MQRRREDTEQSKEKVEQANRAEHLKHAEWKKTRLQMQGGRRRGSRQAQQPRWRVSETPRLLAARAHVELQAHLSGLRALSLVLVRSDTPNVDCKTKVLV